MRATAPMICWCRMADRSTVNWTWQHIFGNLIHLIGLLLLLLLLLRSLWSACSYFSLIIFKLKEKKRTHSVRPFDCNYIRFPAEWIYPIFQVRKMLVHGIDIDMIGAFFFVISFWFHAIKFCRLQLVSRQSLVNNILRFAATLFWFPVSRFRCLTRIRVPAQRRRQWWLMVSEEKFTTKSKRKHAHIS